MKDLLLLPFEMNLLVIDKLYKAKVVYDRLKNVVEWFDVSFDVFIDVVRQYENIKLGFEVLEIEKELYIKRVPKTKRNYEQIRRDTQRETTK